MRWHLSSQKTTYPDIDLNHPQSQHHNCIPLYTPTRLFFGHDIRDFSTLAEETVPHMTLFGRGKLLILQLMLIRSHILPKRETGVNFIPQMKHSCCPIGQKLNPSAIASEHHRTEDRHQAIRRNGRSPSTTQF